MKTYPQLKTLIVDNEEHNRNVFRHFVEQIPALIYCDEAGSVDEALKKIQLHRPHLILLDLDMPGKNGLELLELLRAYQLNPYIIFITAYPQYAIDAIREAGIGFLFDWLDKPIEEGDLALAVKKFPPLPYTSRLIKLSTEREVIYVYPEEIVYCEADGGFTHIYLNDAREKIFICHTLNWLEERLPVDLFFRSHRSYLIRSEYVRMLRRRPNMNCDLILNGKKYEEIPVSRGKFMELKSMMESRYTIDPL